jgi:hypothetical protein
MSEPTMMEAANPTSGTPASSEPAQETKATPAEALYGNQQKAAPSPEPQAAKAVEAVKTEADQKDAPAEKSAGAPEKYEFKAPEGREFDTETLAKFTEVAKELNLTNEAAQAILDKMGVQLSSRYESQIKAAQSQWIEASTADQEFGGAKLTENLSVAKKALDAFGSAELRTLLNTSGLGNHPEIIRFMYRAGKAISEDQVVIGNKGTAKSAGPKSFADLADALYASNP